MPLPTNVQPRGVVPNEVYGVLLALRAANTFYDFLVERAPDALTVQAVSADTIRDSNYEQTTRTILLEGTGTNQLFSSCDFSAGNVDWNAGVADFTVVPVPSCIAGQTAYQQTNKGLNVSRARSQTRGTFTGAPETFSVILENVSAVTSRIGIFDVTANSMVAAADFTWSTHTATVNQGSGAVVVVDMGGGRYRVCLTGTGTVGHSRRLIIYFTGTTQNTSTAIVHHAQHEHAAFASSSIVTTTTAVSRSAELTGWTLPDTPHAMEWIVEFFERGAVNVGSVGVAYLGANSFDSARFQITTAGAGRYTCAHNNGSLSVSSTLPASPLPVRGDRVKLRAVLYADGSCELFQSINGGPEISAGRTAANPFAVAWSGQTFRLNSIGSTNQGNASYLSAILIDTSGVTRRTMLQVLPTSLGNYTFSRASTAQYLGLAGTPDTSAIETFRCIGSQKQYADQRANDGKRWWYRARHVAPLGVTNLGQSDPTDWVSGYPRLITDIGTVIHLDRAPAAPKIYTKFLPGGGLQVFWQGDTDTASVKIAASSTAQPTLDDVRATTAYVGDTGATNGALLTVGTGQRFYVSAVAYNAAGVESTMVELADTRLGLNVDRDEALITAIPQTFSTQITYAISMSDSVAFAEMWVKETGTNPGADVDIAHQSGARKFTTIYNKDGRQLTINVPVSIPGNFVTAEFLPYDILGLPGTTSVTVAQSKAVPESGPPGAPSFVSSTSTSITMQSNLPTTTQAGDTVRFYRHEILQLAGSQPDALQGTVVVQAADVTNGYVHWTDTTVHTGHTYGYEATVQEAGFNESPKTASTTMQPAAATKINTPMLGAGSYSTSSASIPFTITPGANTPAGATYHLLQYEGSDPTNGVYAEVKTTTGTSFSYSVSQQSTSRILYFKVYATATDWTTSDNSAYVQVTIPAYTPPEGGGGGGGGGTQLEEPV